VAAPHLDDQTKTIGDVVSIGTVAATLVEWLPAVAAILTIVWTLIRIYETDTVQKLLKKNTPAG
jgi:hypothetical protein